jgi:hypothetical protein
MVAFFLLSFFSRIPPNEWALHPALAGRTKHAAAMITFKLLKTKQVHYTNFHFYKEPLLIAAIPYFNKTSFFVSVYEPTCKI